MLLPIPGPYPERSGDVAVVVQLNVAPGTLDVLLIRTGTWEQSVCEFGEFVTNGPGLTVTMTLEGVPGQLLAVAIMV